MGWVKLHWEGTGSGKKVHDGKLGRLLGEPAHGWATVELESGVKVKWRSKHWDIHSVTSPPSEAQTQGGTPQTPQTPSTWTNELESEGLGQVVSTLKELGVEIEDDLQFIGENDLLRKR